MGDQIQRLRDSYLRLTMNEILIIEIADLVLVFFLIVGVANLGRALVSWLENPPNDGDGSEDHY